jgi:hypothetical protein
LNRGIGSFLRDYPDLIAATASELLTELSEADGILQKLEPKDNRYIFLHRTFQEYLTASYLKRMTEEDEEEGIELAKKHFWDFEWHESLALLTGMMEDPLPLLRVIVNEKDDIFSTMLLLLGQCLVECEADVQKEMPKVVNGVYQLWHLYPQLKYVTSVVAMLGSVNTRLFGLLSGALNDEDSDVRWEAAEALGRIGSDAAIGALSKALDHEDSDVRWRAAEALGRIGSDAAIGALSKALDHEDSDIRWKAAEALGRIGDIRTLEKLVEGGRDLISDPIILNLARKLVIRSRHQQSSLIPLYPELVKKSQ